MKSLKPNKTSSSTHVDINMTPSLKPNVPLSDPRVKLELVLAFIIIFFNLCSYVGTCLNLPSNFGHVCRLKTPFLSMRLSFLAWKVEINKNIRANMVNFALQTNMTLAMLSNSCSII